MPVFVRTDTDPSVDWMLRHGRCCALAVTLKECPQKVWLLQLRSSLVQTTSQLAVADRVSGVEDGKLRCWA